jgi:hypothetical protein
VDVFGCVVVCGCVCGCVCEWGFVGALGCVAVLVCVVVGLDVFGFVCKGVGTVNVLFNYRTQKGEMDVIW